jgi:excisionase family DNA binding protein
MKERRTISSRLLSMQEAAVYLNIPLNTLYKMVSQGKVPVVKINRLNRFDQVLLDDWIKKNTRMPMYS